MCTNVCDSSPRGCIIVFGIHHSIHVSRSVLTIFCLLCLHNAADTLRFARFTFLGITCTKRNLRAVPEGRRVCPPETHPPNYIMTSTTSSADRLAAFHRRHQGADESFDHFYAALAQLLPEPNPAMLRDAIVRGVHDAQTRDQLRRLAPDVTLANAVALCRMADVLRGARSADSAATMTPTTTTMTQHSAKATTASTEAFIEVGIYCM